MIDKRGILLGIKHFKQRGTGITTEILPHLVDFVEQEKRILDRHLGHVLQNLARHRANIGPAMATNFGFVTHATETHAHEFTPRRCRDRLPQRGLADARWPDETENWRLQFIDSLLHGEVLDDAFLDLFQPPMIAIKDLAGLGEILADARLLAPGQVDQRFDEIAYDRRFGGHRRHQLEFLEFGLDLGHALLTHAGFLGLFLKLLVISALLTLAKFLLDRLDLFVEVVLALALLHLAFDATTNTLLDLKNIDFCFKLGKQSFNA